MKKTIIAVTISFIMIFSIGCSFGGSKDSKSLLEKLTSEVETQTDDSSMENEENAKTDETAQDQTPSAQKPIIDTSNLSEADGFIMAIAPSDILGTPINTLSDLPSDFSPKGEYPLGNGTSIVSYMGTYEHSYTEGGSLRIIVSFIGDAFSYSEKTIKCASEEEMVSFYDNSLNLFNQYLGTPASTDEIYNSYGANLDLIWEKLDSTVFWDVGDAIVCLEYLAKNGKFEVTTGFISKQNLPSDAPA